MTRNFDLNIEKILEGWEVRHAIRELIANAIDEQCLSATAEVTISRENQGAWTIRDYGRGLRYENLTQNENEEKLRHPGKVIGKFGVGLKDALATLNRHSVQVRLRSRHCDIALSQMSKHDFVDVITLHAAVSQPTTPHLDGTEVILMGITDNDMAAAKESFLRFSNPKVLDETVYGQIVQRDPQKAARIYVTGLLVAEEDNFAFSYNITSLTAPMRRALNRERTNVGRTAYADRIKAMLMASTSDAVANILAEDLVKMEHGGHHDEVQWADVATHACRILSASSKVVFVTTSDLVAARDAIDRTIADGNQVVAVPDTVHSVLSGLSDIRGNPVRDLAMFQSEQARQFEFQFVDASMMTAEERMVFSTTPNIAALAGGLPGNVHHVLISEELCPDLWNGTKTLGLWDAKGNRIIIKRSQLSSLSSFAGTLLHEITHARTGHADVTREFETALTHLLGHISEEYFRFSQPAKFANRSATPSSLWRRLVSHS